MAPRSSSGYDVGIVICIKNNSTRAIGKVVGFAWALISFTACTGSPLFKPIYDSSVDGDSTATDATACGQGDDEKRPEGPPSLKIFHGTDEPFLCLLPEQKNAVVAIQFEYLDWENGCTALYVGDRLVVTAAHCLYNWAELQYAPEQLRIAFGPDAANPVFTANVESLHPHPLYDGDAVHDVGVIVLSESVDSSGLQIWPIPMRRDDLPENFLGGIVQQVGYGGTEVSEDNTKRFWTVEEVVELYGLQYVVSGGHVSSVCWGDSGGPSFLLDPQGRLQAVGVVSWGDPSCMDNDYFCRLDGQDDFFAAWDFTTGCHGVDEAGHCVGKVALWCEEGSLRQGCCADTGLTCGENGLGQNRCVGVSPCGDLGYLGRCEGTVAKWCEDGEIKTRHCEYCNQTCGWAGPRLGFYCKDKSR